ncbi:MAG: hypothetical protein H0U60_19600 [Blastocatellia bacterium]|nr:hypothetical protein [Blastocatellia bacterium]
MQGSYIALGDSIQIDSYPAEDHGLKPTAKVGAASRFGAWLLSMGYVDQQFNLAVDGAVISEIQRQIRHVPSETRHLVNIITLTAGGNNLSFGAMEWNSGKADKFAYPILIERIKDEYKELCRTVSEKFPNSYVLVNTHYDPTDGTGRLPNCGAWSDIVDWYHRGRKELSDYTRSRDPLPNDQFIVCDLFKLFDGHGMAEKEVGSRWYYDNFMIEPGYEGARRIAKHWVYKLKANAKFEQYEQMDFAIPRV